MNSRQKEILQSQLDSEQSVLKKLRGIYKKALDDIDGNIAALMGRTDTENLQSVIYQLQYQKALKTQINGILDTLNGEQFNTIADYLSKSYEDGFAGVMYDLHGQGIPLIFPIDQDQVVRALQHDTKLSKPLYESLGEDVSLLKKRIQNNISRGIAQGSSYADIAQNVASEMVGDYSKMRGGALGKAYTITRTEGHRITNEAAYDAQKKAKEKGADVVKQWDASIDRRTRPHHAQLNGQIKELDEPFEVAGRHTQYPGGFGVASEDINCRCAVVQRARGTLDEDELERAKKEAAYFGLDDAENFKSYRKQYLKVSGRITEYEQNIGDTTKRLLEKAIAAEPKITKDLQQIVNDTRGTINYDVGNGKTSLDYRLKTEDSLKRKVTSDFLDGYDLNYIESHIYDNVRYTDLVNGNFLVGDYAKIQDQLEADGYKILRVKNTLGNSKAAYRGLNTIIETSDGYKFELQFHTPESIDIKERVHKLYEVYRLDTTSEAEKLELDKKMRAISSSLPRIKNINAIKSYDTFKGEEPIKIGN